MQITKREFLAATAALALAGNIRSANAATAINYWHHFTSQSEMAGLLKIIELFAKTHPGVTVTQESIPNSEYMAKVSSAVVAGGRPDTGMVIAERFADLTAMGALTDITKRVSAWKGKANLPENRWTGMSQGGAVYAVPAYAFVDWMYYRKDYFEEAGLAGPPKTLDEFVTACRKLTNPTKGRYAFGMRGGAGAFKYVIDMMESFGSPIVKDGQAAIDKAAAVEAISFYSSLFLKEKVVPPSAPNDSYRQIMEGFRTGQTAMVWHHTGSLIEISAALKAGEQFATAPMPAGPKAHIARVAYAGNGIMKDDNIDAAWDWISFWGETDAAVALLEATGYFPASTAALEDKRIKSNPVYQAASKTLEFGRLPNSFVGAAGWSENVVNPAFQSVLTGQLTPVQAVDRMIQGLEAALR
ncbi:Secreted sugar-binding protein (plasmid) [Neorhizobium galegae bv. officinalis bv. officinalis str. HAMBI 1141]|uniref:Secreted sugar-binding protein n=1 Tax=Neorhizobium galegae bv. officinalis bv. officinalis str. HAMBI 1141 TaxID=1028801 RepID=A0A068TH84_NEOGA|nr:sugar ABC transporter substrate-binding protein [Neorhizobium galegae]CDN57807.1 Secreted sugar-binding protein [Neorhizobium galegae bv. officinalis bv. officinalis str. HAMBI 1141]